VQTTKLLVFVPLEGVLLDSRGRVLPGAEEAAAQLDSHGIPLILVTSGTRAETDVPRRALGHVHPFIAEDGGGVFLPEGYFHLRIPGVVRLGRFLSMPLARPLQEASAALRTLAESIGIEVVTFSDMTAREIARNSGMPLPTAELARQRDFQEVFFFAGAGEGAIHRFVEDARRSGARILRRDPFWLFSLGADLRTAVSKLTALYDTARRTRVSTLAVGAALEDAALLKAVHRVVLLPQSEGQFAPELEQAFPKATRLACPGMAGFHQLVELLTARD
jgi:mannosyl-3-phosphoglycerate phosphatase family protein